MNPTRVTLTTSSIIDHIATTCARNISDSGVHAICDLRYAICEHMQIKFTLQTLFARLSTVGSANEISYLFTVGKAKEELAPNSKAL